MNQKKLLTEAGSQANPDEARRIVLCYLDALVEELIDAHKTTYCLDVRKLRDEVEAA